MDVRKILDKRSVQQKKGLLTDAEIQKLVTEWQDERGEEDLDQATIDREVKTMEEKDLLFCTRIGRWPPPLPSYLCNPANALGLSIEEKDLLFCKRIGRWPLPLPSFILAGGWVK